MEIRVSQGLDPTGRPYEFTWDLYPVLPSSDLAHLDDNGLPRIGTCIKEGMVVVGKNGTTALFDPKKTPSANDYAYYSREELLAIFGDMWHDGSYYAKPGDAGKVVSAALKEENGSLVAVIQIEPCERQETE
jgi:DNA-directed RNA polymerase beta subunit